MKNKELESCVFYFFYENELKNKKQKIHKIYKKDFFIQNELTNQQKLFNINSNTIKIKQHFYLCENTSELKIAEFIEDDKNIKRNYSKKDDTILLEFEDRKLIYFKNYLKNQLEQNCKQYILNIIYFYKHMLNSIQILVDNNLFHNHIHFDSIVIDNFDYPLLSNFAFSIDYSHTNIHQHITQFVLAYDPSYIEWPIELHLLSYLLTNKLNSLSSYNIENIINEVVKHNNILNTFGDSVVSSYVNEASKYFSKYVNQSYDFIVSDVLKHINTWDNYALSILFLRILIGIHKTIGIKNKFIIFFMRLLVNNIHLNPLKRHSIDTTINNFNSLLDSLEPKDYKDVINCLTV